MQQNPTHYARHDILSKKTLCGIPKNAIEFTVYYTSAVDHIDCIECLRLMYKNKNKQLFDLRKIIKNMSKVRIQ